MLGYGVREGEIEHGEREIIERVFAFNDLKVRDVMTPKGKIFSLDGSLTVAEALPLVIEKPFSRIPLYKSRSDDFYKVLYLRDLLEAAASGRLDVQLEAIGHELLFISQYQAMPSMTCSPCCGTVTATLPWWWMNTARCAAS